MNSQFQKPPTGAKGGRSSAGDPPYAADTKSRSQSAGARGKSDLGDFSRSGETGSAGKQPWGNSPSVGEFGAGSKPVGSPPVGSGDMTKPTVAPSFGSSDSKPDYSQSRDSSGISAASAHKLGSDYQSGSAGASKPRPTGTEALIDETHDTLGKAAETVYAASGAVHEATAQIADVAKEAFGATVSAVTAQAAALTSNITDELTQTAEAQKERGADAMHRLAKAFRTAAQELDDGSPEVARRVRAAAGSVDSLSSNLHGKSIGDLFTAASDFARNQPAAFFAGAVIAGFAFSRFLKSSSQPPAPPNGGHEATPPAASPSFGTGNISPSAPSTASF